MSYPTIHCANSCQLTKRGLPKSERQAIGYESGILNIRHGNGAFVVVRAGGKPCTWRRKAASIF